MQGFRIRRFGMVLATAVLAAASLGERSHAVSQATEALYPAAPPALDYGRICRKPDVPAPLAFDWRGWTGGPVPVSQQQVFADAIRFIDGGSEVTRDLPLARRMLEMLVSQGTGPALGARRRLALLLLDDRAGPQDRKRAADLLVEATASQETDAALSLGRLIAEGELPGLPLPDAPRYLGIAAGFGEPMAAFELSALYANGALPAPFEEAAAHFANLGTINLQTALASGDCAVAAEFGQFLVDKNLPDGAQRAVAWFEVAAKAGHRNALEKLARAYATGRGVEAQPEAARRYWSRAVEAGSVAGLAALAEQDLIAGLDTQDVRHRLQLAMANGDPNAFLLAARFYRGDFNAKADFRALQQVLDQATARSDVSIFTLDILGNAMLSGQGTAPDLQKAKAIYERILAYGTADAEAIYGRYLLKSGAGIEQAVTHLQKAEATGSALVTTTLADIAACRQETGFDQPALLRKAASAGNPLALRKLARLSLDVGNKAQAATLFEKAASLGDRIAMIERAAAILREAEQAGREAKVAAELIDAAGAPGEGIIAGRLALYQALRNGRLGEDAGRSTALLQTLTASFDPAADVEIVRDRLKSGSITSIDPEARQRLERAATAGNADAMLMLAHLLAADKATAAQATEWLIRAAEQGNSEALSTLPTDRAVLTRVTASLENVLLCDGDTLAQKARLYRLLGNQDAASAALATAERVATTRSPRQIFALAQAVMAITPQATDDTERAARLLLKSAEAGYGKASLALARLYDGGKLGDRHLEAIDWYRRAALADEQTAVPELARLASGGADANALQALKSVAIAGNVTALRSLGMLLATRTGADRDEGIHLLEEAAARKDVAAMKILARFHASGLDGQVSAAKSTQWTRMAAEEGDAEAMFQYALALDLGFGVESDAKSAKTWHQKALENGFVQ
ncbi:tetratricopeptide repeat protein [Rhizobium glycinendophyticum]|uniref:Sel1 repeat family protein n=1 Tax=Rhizobium glycinendophyticum TaxID=2589807 RepID=A0A504UBE0_9HYPH|nr:tetratricopeptide repeat protein [Rhizobium glycinendophyticum]TPP06956.1 sel1 repeat family protein [Rhizobium glycinendophyticum]